MGLCALCLHTKYQGDGSQHTLPEKAASIQTKSSPSIPDKVAGVEGLELNILMQTQKPQISSEQPLTKKKKKKKRNLPEKITYIQR